MKHFWRVIAVLAGIAIVCAVVAFTLMIVSGYLGDRYSNRLKVAFNAAAINYAPGDPVCTVVVTYNGQEREMDPDDYRALSYYMRMGAVGQILPRGLKGECVRVVICATDTAEIYKLDDESAVVVFESDGKSMRVRVQGDNLWASLIGVMER